MRTPVVDIDEDLLRRLWPTSLPDKQLEQRLNICRGSFRRVAKRLGLPPRIVARQRAFEAEGRP